MTDGIKRMTSERFADNVSGCSYAVAGTRCDMTPRKLDTVALQFAFDSAPFQAVGVVGSCDSPYHRHFVDRLGWLSVGLNLGETDDQFCGRFIEPSRTHPTYHGHDIEHIESNWACGVFRRCWFYDETPGVSDQGGCQEMSTYIAEVALRFLDWNRAEATSHICVASCGTHLPHLTRLTELSAGNRLGQREEGTNR